MWALFIATLLILYFSLNIISGGLFNKLRLDFTQEKLHTISDGTKQILSQIDEPIKIDVYFSAQLASLSAPYKDFYDRLKTMLETYERLAGDKLTVNFYNPEPYSELEDEALILGLKGATINSFQEQVYFGLVAKNSVNVKETIPFFSLEKEPFLEYDLSLLIHKLSSNGQTKVGVLSAVPTTQKSLLFTQLQKTFELSMLDNTQVKIDDSISSLIVIKPEALPKEALFAIDQFALKGGNLLVFTDPIFEGDKELADSNQFIVQDMLKNWGVEYSSEKIAIDLQYSVSVNSNTQQGTMSIRHPAWFELPSTSFAPDNIITNNLDKMMLASVGFLKPITKADIKEGEEDSENVFIPLIQSSIQATTRGARDFRFLRSADTLRQAYVRGDETLTYAAHILTKNVETVFDAGITNEDTNETTTPELFKATSNVNAIIIADADLLEDKMWARANNFLGQQIISQISDNAKFVINAIESLSGNDSFINLRGRGKGNRTFTLLTDMQLEAEQQFSQKENALRSKLNNLQSQISQRRSNIKDSDLLSKEQERLINEAQNEMVKVRKELRSVQHNLKKDIDSVTNMFKWVNILVVPLLIVLLAFGLRWYLRSRREKYFI